MMNVSSAARRAATISHLFPHIQTNGTISSMTGEPRLYHANSTRYSHSLLSVFMMDFMQFSPGVSAVTLKGGRAYHRILPAHEGQHAILDGSFMIPGHCSQRETLEIPNQCIHNALAGLERVNPFISELENPNVYDDDDDIALHLEYTSSPILEIAATISLAPASLPTRRKLVSSERGRRNSTRPHCWCISAVSFCVHEGPLCIVGSVALSHSCHRISERWAST